MYKRHHRGQKKTGLLISYSTLFSYSTSCSLKSSVSGKGHVLFCYMAQSKKIRNLVTSVKVVTNPLLGSLSKHDVDGSENVIWKCNFAFLQYFFNLQSHHAWKTCSNYPGIKLKPALGTQEDKIEHLSSYAHVVYTTAKQVISRRRKNENVVKVSKKNEICTCKACKNTVFHCQIYTFVGFFVAVVVVVT